MSDNTDVGQTDINAKSLSGDFVKAKHDLNDLCQTLLETQNYGRSFETKIRQHTGEPRDESDIPETQQVVDRQLA